MKPAPVEPGESEEDEDDEDEDEFDSADEEVLTKAGNYMHTNN